MLNPGVVVFPVSCQTGEGILAWDSMVGISYQTIEKRMITEIVGLKNLGARHRPGG